MTPTNNNVTTIPATNSATNSIVQWTPNATISYDYNRTTMSNMDTSTSITKIATSLVKAQRKMGSALKDSKNPFFKSSYADLNSIREATLPVLLDEGISVLQPTVVINGKNYVRTLLLHESGEWLSCDTEIVVAKQNDPQASGSGISYARRYGLQSFLNVGATDDDGELAMGRKQANYREESVVANAIKSVLPTNEPVKKAASFRKPGNVTQSVPAAGTAETQGTGWE